MRYTIASRKTYLAGKQKEYAEMVQKNKSLPPDKQEYFSETVNENIIYARKELKFMKETGKIPPKTFWKTLKRFSEKE